MNLFISYSLHPSPRRRKNKKTHRISQSRTFPLAVFRPLPEERLKQYIMLLMSYSPTNTLRVVPSDIFTMLMPFTGAEICCPPTV